VISGNRTRTYGVNVPHNYNSNLGKQWPLIIDYHGNNGTPDQQYNNSMYWKYSKGQDYLIVCTYKTYLVAHSSTRILPTNFRNPPQIPWE
jgi:poly(3-hydroxybutyrate) depolymerase